MRLDYEALYDAVRSCDLRRVLEQRGYAFQRGKDGFFQDNPTRTEQTSSIRVRTDNPHKWHDFGSGEGGDLVDFLRAAESLDKDAAEREAASILGVTSRTRGGTHQKRNTAKNGEPATKQPARNLEQPPGNLQPLPDLEPVVEAAYATLQRGETIFAKRARLYLQKRGLDPDGDAVKRARVGVIDETVRLPADAMKQRTFFGRLVFPYVDRRGGVPFLNARAAGDVEDGEKFRKPAGLEQVVPFNLTSLNGAEHVILVEGELDALAVMEALGPDTPVVATGGGALKRDHVPLLQEIPLAFVLFDRDERGEAFQKATRESLEAVGVKVALLDLPAGAKDASEALTANGKDDLRQALEQQIDAARRPGDYGYLVTTFLQELDRRHERPWPAYPTGLAELDDLLDGGYHEGLHVLGGLTGGGKTSFALRVALRNASEGRSVVYATFEQSKHELWSRLAAAATRLPYSALKRGTYLERGGDRVPAAYLLEHKPQWPDLLKASENLLVLEAGDALSRKESAYSVHALQELAARLKDQTGVPPLVVIDYLQRVPAKDLAGRDIRERVGHVAGLLQVGLAREVGCPVLALSSMNRASYATAGAKATQEQRLASLKESGEVEYSAYTVAMLYAFRDGEEPAGMVPGPGDDWKPVGLSLAKNREGRSGDVMLRWEPIGDKWSAALKKEVRR